MGKHTAVGFKRKAKPNPFEGLRRMLSKDGLSASDKKEKVFFLESAVTIII